jgi:hypothetical protein
MMMMMMMMMMVVVIGVAFTRSGVWGTRVTYSCTWRDLEEFVSLIVALLLIVNLVEDSPIVRVSIQEVILSYETRFERRF